MFFVKSFLLTLLLSAALFASSQIYELKNYVNDFTHTLNAEQIASLEAKLKKEDSLAQIVVLIVPKIEGYSLEEYSIKTATQNKIGHKDKDNGVLILIVMDSKEVRIEVGYGLEAKLSDLVTSRIIRKELIGNFKEQHYYKGINKAIESIIDTIGSSTSAVPKVQKTHSNNIFNEFFIVTIVVMLFMIIDNLKEIRKYKVLAIKRASQYFLFLILVNAATFYFLDSTLEDTLIYTMIISISAVFIAFILSLVFAMIFGYMKNVKFLYTLYTLYENDKKIQNVLRKYHTTSLSQYKEYFELLKHEELFMKFSSKRARDIKSYYENAYVANLYENDEQIEYHLFEIRYLDDNAFPKITLHVYDDSKELHSKEYSFEELKKYLRAEIGLITLISSLSFTTFSKQSSSGGFGSGSSSGGGFSGGGGSFGGGGASSRW